MSDNPNQQPEQPANPSNPPEPPPQAPEPHVIIWPPSTTPGEVNKSLGGPDRPQTDKH
jgi:hypothetical protein